MNRYTRYRARLRKEDPVKYTARHMRNNACTRSKRAGIPFDLSTEYVISICPELCPVFGVKLEYGGAGQRRRTAASLDRIVPELGYVKGNVQVLSMLANRMKSNVVLDLRIMFPLYHARSALRSGCVGV